MSLEKVIIPTEKELIIRQLESRIVSGELAVGLRLPTERELAEQLGVKKTVLHFALKELEQLKFIRCVPRHGTYVNDWMNAGNFETLNAVLRLQGVNVDPVLKDSLIRMRNLIESDAMELCSSVCTQEDFDELQAAIDDLAAVPDEAGSAAQAEKVMYFHLLIVRKSGNRMYPILMNAFRDFSLIIWMQCVDFWSKAKIVEFEQLQLNLIRTGKGAEAGAHICRMYEEVLKSRNS